MDGSTPTQHRKPFASKTQSSTAMSLVTPSNVNCVYCSQPHSSSSCRTVPSIEARKQTLKRTGRCYICLRQNHISRNCRAPHKCSRCRGRHHLSICSQVEPEGSSNTNSAESTTPSTPVMYIQRHRFCYKQPPLYYMRSVILGEP